MFGSAKYGANAYSSVGVETGVSAASPHKLIVMLYDGALVSLANAQQHLKVGEVAEKGRCISKAIMIIDNGLRSSLDKKVGGQIAENLDALYEYMNRRLLEANVKNDAAIVDEVYKLLLDLKNTWEMIGETPETQESAPVQAAAYDQLSPKNTSLVRA